MNAIEISPGPLVFEYDDYRVFLRDIYSFLKKTKPQFSYRYFSKRAGFLSPNFLKLVIEGKRNLSEESITKFCQALKLSREESEYFSHLVAFNQSEDPNEKSKAAQKLTRSRSFQKIRPIKQAQYEYYACWYYIPIREMVKFPDFQEDSEWIASRFSPRLHPQDAKRALEALEAMGLLERSSEGRLVQSVESLATSDEVMSTLIAAYHREMMKRAADSIAQIERQFREISSVCVPVSGEAMKKIKGMIQDFRDEILTVAAADSDCDRVYQLNFQLFPLTKVK